ncbi:four helix bundle protein [Vibrio hannami]|uniref:four helix bundle protein n=1 Tax=Vibrio hannami TaxID=2717094 RepID=UPI0024103E68|nr:four helix bundle protein [Vibrio hannami]MDG3086904.1 four helix bundle protein [Vibrio hannami]
MKFDKLQVWQDSFELSVLIHKELTSCRDYGFCDQLRRSSVSIPSNIAEGMERGTNKDSVRFLFYAKGSTAEVLTQVRLGVRFGYIEQGIADKVELECIKISKMLTSLIKHRQKTA